MTKVARALPDRRIGSHGELIPRFGFSRHRLRDAPTATPGSVWQSHDGLRVISSLTDAYLPGTDDTEVGPHWQISVSTPNGRNRRPSDADMARVVDAFGLPAWDEDNHHPGVARHLWCPIDERYRTACECKVTERTVVEPDGYRWTTPRDGDCRGCELARAFPHLPCTIHGARR